MIPVPQAKFFPYIPLKGDQLGAFLQMTRQNFTRRHTQIRINTQNAIETTNTIQNQCTTYTAHKTNNEETINTNHQHHFCASYFERARANVRQTRSFRTSGDDPKMIKWKYSWHSTLYRNPRVRLYGRRAIVANDDTSNREAAFKYNNVRHRTHIQRRQKGLLD